LGELSSRGKLVLPVTLNLTAFTEKLNNKETWFSDPFFTSEKGYKMCLKVYVGGNYSGEDTHLSLLVYLMKGPYDDDLEQSGHFPLRRTFAIELLNQLNNENHYYNEVKFDNTTSTVSAERVVKGEIAPKGLGYTQFIPHHTILHYDGFLKDDTIYFRISLP